MNGLQPQRWHGHASPVEVIGDSEGSDLARAVDAALRSGAELTIEQHTVVQVGPASGPRQVVGDAVRVSSVVHRAPVVTGVAVTPIDDPPAVVRDRSFWVSASIVAGCVVVAGLAVVVAVLFVVWVMAGLTAVATWLAVIGPYVLAIGAILALVMLVGAAKTGKCPGVHCPGRH